MRHSTRDNSDRDCHRGRNRPNNRPDALPGAVLQPAESAFNRPSNLAMSEPLRADVCWALLWATNAPGESKPPWCHNQVREFYALNAYRPRTRETANQARDNGGLSTDEQLRGRCL